jgi:hypothetical protein
MHVQMGERVGNGDDNQGSMGVRRREKCGANKMREGVGAAAGEPRQGRKWQE